MVKTSVFKFLPLILAALIVVGAIMFASQKFAAKKKIEGVFTKLPEPTPFIPVKPFRGETANTVPTATPTPTPTATPIPTVTEKVAETDTTKGGVKKTVVASKTTTKTETVCTPVYGMANTCAEHTVVDTGLETSAFSTLAALSYFGGLAAFIKAKKRA